MSGPARGVAAHKEVADAAKQNRGGGFTRLLMMKAGEKALVRFRGYTRPLAPVSEDELKTYTIGQLRALCRRWSVYEKVEDATIIDTLVGRLMDRQKQLEPMTVTEDYIHNNQSGRKYVTCAKEWDGTDCVSCQMRAMGDKRVSQKVSGNFSIVPQRKYHYVKGATKDDNDFAYCSNYGYDATGRCTYCIKKIEAKQEGMKRFSVATMHSQGVFAAADRIAKRCAACEGMGHIQHVCWACAACGEVIDNVVEPDKGIKCSACKASSFPVEEVTCSRGCAAARRGQLFDTDILIERVGALKQTTYQFNEQYPFTPLPEDMLKFRVPTWEVALKPGNTDTQCRAIGVQVNPFTKEPVGKIGPAGEATSYDEPGGETYDTNAPASDVPY